jgi:hypothetical protein
MVLKNGNCLPNDAETTHLSNESGRVVKNEHLLALKIGNRSIVIKRLFAGQSNYQSDTN